MTITNLVDEFNIVKTTQGKSLLPKKKESSKNSVDNVYQVSKSGLPSRVCQQKKKSTVEADAAENRLNDAESN